MLILRQNIFHSIEGLGDFFLVYKFYLFVLYYDIYQMNVIRVA